MKQAMMKRVWHKSFADRAAHFANPVAKRLCEVAEKKQTNLVLSADVTSADQLLTLADKIGPKVAVLKTHIDIVSDFSQDFIKQLRAIADKHEFLIFEDRKFADIGKIVVEQCKGGIYRIAEWADIINAHIVSGPGIIGSLQMACQPRDVMLLLVSELSAKDTLAKGDYHEKALQFSKLAPDFSCGFIAQRRHDEVNDYLYLSPGVHLMQKGDEHDQQYRDPKRAIVDEGVDFIIVGRGITAESDPEQAAEQYRLAAWEAYQERYI